MAASEHLNPQQFAAQRARLLYSGQREAVHAEVDPLTTNPDPMVRRLVDTQRQSYNAGVDAHIREMLR